jgi:Na+/H+ antiporter NhaC
METIKKHPKMKSAGSFLLMICLTLITGNFAFAQQEGTNQTMKEVFKEVKKEVGGSKDNTTPILMIIAVIIIVGVAIYLSFSDSDTKKTKPMPKK